tara:strand:+ start:43 stop:891 length:849 start_codon:yes stop_codon:yes gene_type:complete
MKGVNKYIRVVAFVILVVLVIPLAVSYDIVKCIVKFFKNNDLEGVTIPVPNTLTSSWNNLIKQVRNTPKKKSSLYPTYFLWFCTSGADIGGNFTHYGSFTDPSGKISEYNFSDMREEEEEEVILPFTNVLEDNEMNEFIENLPVDSRYAKLHQGSEYLINSINFISQEISRKELLKIIDNSKKKDSEYNFKINLNEVIRDITESRYSSRSGWNDTTADYSYILVYDEIKDTYKRIVLNVSGGYYVFNSSRYYISKFGTLEKDGTKNRIRGYFNKFKDELFPI